MEVGLIVALVGLPFSRAIASIGTGIAMAAWVCLMVAERRWLGPRGPLLWTLVALIGWHAASVSWSVSIAESLDGTGKALKYAGLFSAACALAAHPARLTRVLMIWLGSTIVFALDGVYQWMTLVDLFRGRRILLDETPLHMTASFITGNDFGAYLVVALLTWLGWMTGRRRARWLVGGAAMALLGYCLYQTGSRGAWLSGVTAMIVWQGCRSLRAGAVAIALLLAVFLALPPSAKAHLGGVVHLGEGTQRERVVLWTTTLKMIQERPLIGMGSNTYNLMMPQYKPTWYPDVRYAHNCYLQMAAEVGLVGLAIFLGFLALWWWRSLRVVRRDHPMFQGLLWGLVGLLVHSGVDTHLYSLPLATLFWLMAGLIWGVTRSAGGGSAYG